MTDAQQQRVGAFGLVSGMLKPFQVDTTSGVPLYQQVKQYVIASVREGYWKPNAQIPTQAELCGHLGVSRITLVRALQDLVTSGVLEARQGIGTFVRGERRIQQLVSATELYRRTYGGGSSARYHLLDLTKVLPHEIGAEGESFGEDCPLWRIRRLRFEDNSVSSIGVLLFPVQLAPREEDLRDLQAMVLYDFLTRRCGVQVAMTRVHIGAIKLSPQTAQELGSASGEAALVIRRFILDVSDRVVAVSTNTHDTSSSSFYFEFEERAADRLADAGLRMQRR